MKLKFLIIAILTLSIAAHADEPANPAILWGIISDTAGNPLQGVVVSDGYTCTATDSEGRYELAPSGHAVQVNISIPAEYEVTLSDGFPDFWKTITAGTQRYDFTLTPLTDGAEKEFNLFCLADPQCQTGTQADYLEEHYISDVRKESVHTSAELPTYGVVLGDVVWNSDTLNVKETMIPRMKAVLSADNVGLPLFFVIGNHDHSYKDDDDIDAQRDFESAFGPINYSFNRGDAHIICMDDCLFTSATSFVTAFRDDQTEWLRQDLSYVPKDKLIILCVHSPLRNRTSENVLDFLKILDGFPVCHIMSGHMHTIVNYDIPSTRYEHNIGALCGAFWRADVCADGTPIGYSVFSIKGTEFTNWYYKSAGYDRDYQIRLYHASDFFMPVEGKKQFQFKFNAENQIIANVFNADSDWTVEVYEDGEYSGKMTRFTDRDAWAAGFYMGLQGRKPKSSYDKPKVDHLYYHTLSKNSKEAKVEVVATDKFGNVYRQTVFTSNEESDWPEAFSMRN